MSEPVSVEFQSISKSFGEHQVLTDVSFEVRPGDVIALMGENGAGKSTLMRILAGVYPHQSYSGSLKIREKLAKFSSVRDAKSAGIAMIHQELGLFPELTVAENLLLEEIKEKHPFHIKWNQIFDEAQKYLDGLGFQVDARSKVSELRTGACQLVEIARALRTNASVLIMDEPTSALTEPEALRLFQILKKLQQEGKSIFYVSHRMDEIAKVATKVVVLRDGIIAGIDDVKNLDRDKIIRWMVGRDVANIFPEIEPPLKQQRPLLAVRDLTLKDKVAGKTIVNHASFEIFPGEILGLGGLMGAGRSELALALFGYFGPQSPKHSMYEVSGKIDFDGRDTHWDSPRSAQSFHVAMLTEDRKGTGLFLNRPASENMTVTVVHKMASKRRLGAIDRRAEKALIKQLSTDLKVRGPGLQAEVGVYSGGNQQKVALAKCLALQPKLLILDEPTRGVDIGAKLEIYELMSKLSKNGVAILLISSEMPELLGLSHRVAVLKEGTITKTFDRASAAFDAEQIMHAASL